MLNTKYIAVLIGALSACSASAGTAENITNLENQLNQCREEYKALVAKTNQEIKDLKANFDGECCEVGMYLAMARVAHREGYPEIGLY